MALVQYTCVHKQYIEQHNRQKAIHRTGFSTERTVFDLWVIPVNVGFIPCLLDADRIFRYNFCLLKNYQHYESVHFTHVLLSILTEVFPCFFFSCKANARVYLAETWHGPHSSLIVLFCVLFCVDCVVLCIVCV